MASYFDAQPQSKRAAELVDLPDEEAFGKPSIMSPHVNRLLNDLDDRSSSDDEDVQSVSDTDKQKRKAGQQPKGDSSTSIPSKSTKRVPPPRPGLGVGVVNARHQHLARFHSLRNMLFSSQIEENMSKHAKADAEAESKWRGEHEQRRGLHRPKTPPSPKRTSSKEGLAHRISDRLRRMTSKEPPTLKKIKESDQESTASSDDEDTGHPNVELGKKNDEPFVSEDESIHHSDVEELVRWVSRRDPPSDGEAVRKQDGSKLKIRDGQLGVNDGGHDSLGHSDVDELVRYASRRSRPTAERLPSNYGDVSTESDSEANIGGSSCKKQSSSDESGDDEYGDELVRWVSRREGPSAGPVTNKKKKTEQVLKTDPDAQDSDASEIARWISKEDLTSGESDNDASVRATAGVSESEHERPRRSMTPKDVDELLRWVTRTGEDHDTNLAACQSAPAAEQKDANPSVNGLKKTQSERPMLREMLTNDDIDDLVKWVSRRHDSGQPEHGQRENNILKWKKEDQKRTA